MCGIVGLHFTDKSALIAHEVAYYRLLLTEMLINAQSRGSGATGIVIVNYDTTTKRSKINMFKAPLSAEEFVKTETYKKMLGLLSRDTMYVIGHTRAVTSGSALNNDNNHPHVYGRFVGVHNGMIQQAPLWRAMAPDYKPHGQCDSEAFFAFMDKHVKKGDSVEGAARKFAATADGWYVFTFFDMSDAGQMYIAKDNATPLTGYYSPISDTYAFASEGRHVSLAIEQAAKIYGDGLPKIRNIVESFNENQRPIPANTIVSLDYFWDRKNPQIAQGRVYKSFVNLETENDRQRRFREENEDAFNTTQGITPIMDRRYLQ